ncbi:replication endonuclease [Microbulbifer sp. VVAC002]|uniref:replication endonuclease n=1 Tax=Microbulbifer sp. VVAC002 TaxID=3243387 RepID=UPI00403A0066
MEKITALEQFNNRMPPEIWRWRDSVISQHKPVVSDLVAMYARDCRERGYVQANKNLRATGEALTAPVYSPLAINLDATATATMEDEDIRALAETAAEYCSQLQGESGGDLDSLGDEIEEHVRAHGLEWPVPDELPHSWTREKLDDVINRAILQACDARWWRRQLRKKLGRQVESVLRNTGRVQKRLQPYVSDWAYQRWQKSQHRNRALLESMEAVNELGESVSLAEAQEGSVSNPVNRRHELMVRLRGYEDIAKELGLTGLFLTLTAPSSYHARLHHGPINPKYNGASPDQVQRYLSGVWQKIRARWNKLEIRAFGFRVAEPHHDGTPHWHMLLFFSPEDAETAWAIFRAEALREDGDEKGAEKHRAEREVIDPERSATGYIAKYISKNIDAEGVDVDEEAERPGSDGAGRARAWASLWGIRQFQQIGAVSVTVWRELRRRRKPLEDWEPEEVEAIRAACDAGDWRTFVELMGGPTMTREGMALRAFHFEQEPPSIKGKKEIPLNQYDHGICSRYGDEVKRLLGVVMRNTGRVISTRQHVWNIRRCGGQIRELPEGGSTHRARLMPGLTMDQKSLDERIEIQVAAALRRENGPAKPGRLEFCQ